MNNKRYRVGYRSYAVDGSKRISRKEFYSVILEQLNREARLNDRRLINIKRRYHPKSISLFGFVDKAFYEVTAVSIKNTKTRRKHARKI